MNTNFEKEISNKLYNSESTPPEGMFENIMAKRAKNSKAPLFSGKLTSILIGVVLVSSVLIYFQMNSDENITHQVSNNEISNTIDNNQADIESRIDKSEFKRETKISNNANNIANVESKNSKSKLKSIEPNSKNKVAEVNNNKLLGISESNPSTQELKLSNKLSDKYKSIINKKSNDYITSDNVYQSYFDANSTIKPVIASEQHKGKSHLYQYESIDESLIDKSDINFFFANKMNKLKVKNSPEEIAAVKTKKIEIPKKLRNPLFIDFTTMPMFTLHHAFGNSPLLSDYHQLEKTTMNHLFELRVNQTLKNNLSVYTGIAYSQMNHQYEGEITKTKHVVEYVNRTIYINDPITGVRQEIVTDRLEYDKEVKTNFNFKNKYQVFQLPLGVSYNYGYKKFDFAINTGINFNLINSMIGYNLNSNSDGLIAYSSSKKSFNLGANFGVMATYPLTYKYKLVFEPHLNMFNINANKLGNNINPNTLNLGVKLGLRYTVF